MSFFSCKISQLNINQAPSLVPYSTYYDMTFKSVNEKTATIYRFKNKSEVYYINSIELN